MHFAPDVPKQPYAIASTFEWWVPDLHCAADVEAVYTLLSENYVEDDDSMFRFNYSADFLQWALTPPGYFPDWHVAVRKKSDQKLLAFISGIPMHVCVGPSERVMCEINFLCVHKKLREKRMAPILIKEVTRRVNLRNWCLPTSVTVIAHGGQRFTEVVCGPLLSSPTI